MKLLVVSTSKVHGKPYLSYLKEEVLGFFLGKNLVFVPYARPGGMSWDEYTALAQGPFAEWGYTLKGIHTFESPAQALAWADGVFTGGGNTFLLLKTLYENGSFGAIQEAVKKGLPYMGSSAGSNLCGLTIGTTNDMPIVYPPSFDAFGFLPFNINPHYLDPLPDSTHMGETREQRINEFHVQNEQMVVGLREGSWLHVEGGKIQLKGTLNARIFKRGMEPLEVPPGTML